MLRADVGGSVYRGPVGFGHCAAQQEGGYECCGERVARTDSVGYFNVRSGEVAFFGRSKDVAVHRAAGQNERPQSVMFYQVAGCLGWAFVG